MDKGYKKVYALKGGFDAWTHAVGQTEPKQAAKH
jgi:rhodanese-related sulfurtransferase